MKSRWLLLCLLLVYLTTGIFQIKPGEWPLVCRFGKPLQELRGPGLHWGLPWGLDQVHRIAVDEQRRLVVGYLDETGPDDNLAPLNQTAPSGHLLTGDNQMINLRVIVLYRVLREKLAEYVQQQHKMEDLLQRASEEVMTNIVASQRIDHLLTGRTAAVESAMADKLRERMVQYNTGVLIDSVNVAAAQPPQELVEIFRDVNRARAQRDVSITEAQSRRNADVSQALRAAESLRAEAEAYYHRKLAQATSEANSFRALVKSFPRSEPAASAALLQLYLQEMQPIFSRMQIRTLSDQGVEQIVTFPK